MQKLKSLIQNIALFNEAVFKKDFHFFWDATYPKYMHSQVHTKTTKAKDLLIICHYDGSRLDSIGDYHLAFKYCTRHNFIPNISFNDNYENFALEIIDTTTNNFSEDKQECFIEKCRIKLWVAKGYAFAHEDFFTVECNGFYFKKL